MESMLYWRMNDGMRGLSFLLGLATLCLSFIEVAYGEEDTEPESTENSMELYRDAILINPLVPTLLFMYQEDIVGEAAELIGMGVWDVNIRFHHLYNEEKGITNPSVKVAFTPRRSACCAW